MNVVEYMEMFSRFCERHECDSCPVNNGRSNGSCCDHVKNIIGGIHGKFDKDRFRKDVEIVMEWAEGK